MNRLEPIRRLLAYGDWADGCLLDAARRLDDGALDRRFEMGVGTLRRTLIHLYNGEYVWLQRWQERLDTKWPGEDELVAIAALRERFERMWAERDAYLGTLSEPDLAAIARYRDSYGNLYRAARIDMLLQACVHSIHHRAQAANMIRHVGGGSIELDYMVHVRMPPSD